MFNQTNYNSSIGQTYSKWLYIAITILLSLLTITSVYGFNGEALANLSLGYRFDGITAKSEGLDPKGSRVSLDFMDIKVHICEVVLSGELAFPNNWIFEGFTDIGVVGAGRYKEEALAMGLLDTQADLNSGWCADISIDLGYRWPICWGLCLQPSIGWSYDYLKVTTQRTKTNGHPDPILEGVSYTNRWQGPWVGLGSQGCWCGYKLRSGYEYHQPYWKAAWTLAHPDIPRSAFSDHRKSHHASAHVIFIESSYTLPNCWSFGINMRGGYWRATQGTLLPRAGSFSALDIPEEVDVVHQATWYTGQAKIFCGVTF